MRESHQRGWVEWGKGVGGSEVADEINQPCVFHLLSRSLVRETTAKRSVGQLALQTPSSHASKFLSLICAEPLAPHLPTPSLSVPSLPME